LLQNELFITSNGEVSFLVLQLVNPNLLVQIYAKLDPPINSLNWNSCAKLEHVFYLDKYGSNALNVFFLFINLLIKAVIPPFLLCTWQLFCRELREQAGWKKGLFLPSFDS